MLAATGVGIVAVVGQTARKAVLRLEALLALTVDAAEAFFAAFSLHRLKGPRSVAVYNLQSHFLASLQSKSDDNSPNVWHIKVLKSHSFVPGRKH